MSSPLDAAWAVLKADFYIGDPHTFPQGLMAPNTSTEMYEGTPSYGGQGYTGTLERYDHVNRHYNTGRSMASAGMREGNPNMGVAKVTSSPSRQPYYRGGSIPRLNPDGDFVGANVQAAMEAEGVDNFDQFAQRLGGITSHETVHQLINPEMVEWAKQQSGVADLPDNTEMEQRLLSDPAFRRQMEEELGPYYADELLGGHERQMAEHAYRNLNSMGHEKGAFAMTPGISQEEIDKLLQGYTFYPYIRQDDPEPMSELHLTGPSPDQVRYEQMLQEQGLVG